MDNSPSFITAHKGFGDDAPAIHRQSVGEGQGYLQTLVKQYAGTCSFRTGAGHIFFDLVNTLPEIPQHGVEKLRFCRLVADIIYPLAARLFAQSVSLHIVVDPEKNVAPETVSDLVVFATFDADHDVVTHFFLSPHHDSAAIHEASTGAGVSVLCEPSNYHYHQLNDDQGPRFLHAGNAMPALKPEHPYSRVLSPDVVSLSPVIPKTPDTKIEDITSTEINPVLTLIPDRVRLSGQRATSAFVSRSFALPQPHAYPVIATSGLGELQPDPFLPLPSLASEALPQLPASEPVPALQPALSQKRPLVGSGLGLPFVPSPVAVHGQSFMDRFLPAGDGLREAAPRSFTASTELDAALPTARITEVLEERPACAVLTEHRIAEHLLLMTAEPVNPVSLRAGASVEPLVEPSGKTPASKVPASKTLAALIRAEEPQPTAGSGGGEAIPPVLDMVMASSEAGAPVPAASLVERIDLAAGKLTLAHEISSHMAHSHAIISRMACEPQPASGTSELSLAGLPFHQMHVHHGLMNMATPEPHSVFPEVAGQSGSAHESSLTYGAEPLAQKYWRHKMELDHTFPASTPHPALASAEDAMVSTPHSAVTSLPVVENLSLGLKPCGRYHFIIPAMKPYSDGTETV